MNTFAETLRPMRRLLTSFILAFAFVTALGQTAADGTIKFLGIPIDGSKQDMIAQLKDKGFRYFSFNDCLVGQFNGKDVEVHITTNHGVVDRVYVEYFSVPSESRIISEFNVLLGQFNRNRKYASPLENRTIPETEQIGYEMSINNKQYIAGFYYASPDIFSDEELDLIHQLMDNLKGSPKDEVTKIGQEFAESFMKQNSVEDANAFVQKWMTLMDGRVWFTINKEAGDYCLCIYYDNVKNQPNGEDL